MRRGDEVRIVVPASLEYLAPLQRLVDELAAKIGFEKMAREEIQLGFEEAFANVVEHAFDPGEEASFEVRLRAVPLGMEIVVHDEGLPFDPGLVPEYAPEHLKASSLPEGQKESGLGIFLMRHLMDEVAFINLGRKGKETRLIKYLPRKSVQELSHEEELAAWEMPIEEKTAVSVSPPERIAYSIRLLEPRDAVEVARCAYRAYGYSYPNPHIFFPDRVVDLNARGILVSALAVAPDGDIMGHTALEVPSDDPGAPVEIGMAFVKPAYRGQGCLRDLTTFLLDEARRRGFGGAFVQSVTTHPASQKAARSVGFRECGLFIGAYPETMNFKKLGGEVGQRLSLVLAFLPLVAFPAETLHCPPRHGRMLERLFSELGMQPRMALPRGLHPDLELSPGQGEMRVSVTEATAAAEITLVTLGTETQGAIRAVVRQLCRKKIEFISLRLPLRDPATPFLCDALEEEGFFFAGILPHASRGPFLLLQYLNNQIIDYGRIKIASDVAEELLSYVRSCDPGENVPPLSSGNV